MSTEDGFTHHRRHLRRKCFVGVELRPDGTETCVLGNLVNVSLGGCCIETAVPVSVGMSVQITPLERDGDWWVRGRVMNLSVRDGALFHSLGIEFANGDPTETAEVAELLHIAQSLSATDDPQDRYLGRLRSE